MLSLLPKVGVVHLMRNPYIPLHPLFLEIQDFHYWSTSLAWMIRPVSWSRWCDCGSSSQIPENSWPSLLPREVGHALGFTLANCTVLDVTVFKDHSILFLFYSSSFLSSPIVSSRIMPSESQPVLQRPEEEEGFLECESKDISLAAISTFRSSHQRHQQLIIAQGIILAVLLVVIAGILWKDQAVEAGCPYNSTDGQLPDHVYCKSSFPLHFQ